MRCAEELEASKGTEVQYLWLHTCHRLYRNIEVWLTVRISVHCTPTLSSSFSSSPSSCLQNYPTSKRSIHTVLSPRTSVFILHSSESGVVDGLNESTIL
ncbi:hypothetical protein DL89DRAFT_264812 [Linderina pennispora]|uniref:Uncharacterized protein n=1 Tax=Linderina pennispora TaxID=61395 RepID=A0A1Y1WN82_9FUNG|nr:uncharacterized protein DL89DRAFT_264812 [Linderina pennispora]ORX75017.1 hypothetical protein DL89DRAFT_264812 [Linderina pennispora]